MNELALFAGAGGGILGGKLLGWTTVCACELDEYARRVLIARQNDGSLPPFPIWEDVRTFDGNPWRGVVDIVTGGFPCQDISAAGKGAGIDGAKSGMWHHMARIIREVGPRYVLVENSPMLTSRGLGRVVGDLASLGYDARWGVLGARDAGAPHKRERIWIVAHAQGFGQREQTDRAHTVADSGHPRPEPVRSGQHSGDVADSASVGWGARRPGRSDPSGARESELTLQAVADSRRERRGEEREFRSDQSPQRAGGCCEALADAHRSGLGEQRRTVANGEEHEAAECGGWWQSEPDVGRVAHGVASRVDRLRCLGNGQVPHAMVLAWITLCGRTEK